LPAQEGVLGASLTVQRRGYRAGFSPILPSRW
jgi:hypothetical protein